MEDALVHLIAGPWQFITCLNPCFNGRCTSTGKFQRMKAYDAVLILVLMEDALVQKKFC